MSAQPHTPWTAEWIEENSDWCVMGAVSEPDEKGGTWQPAVCTLSDSFSGDTARLIAAAPELLEACQWLKSYAEVQVRRHTDMPDTAGWQSILDAIAKATGESQ